MVKKLVMLAIAVLGVGMAVPSTRETIVQNSFVPAKNWIGYQLIPRRLEVMADQLDVRLERAEGLPGNFEGWLRRDYSSSELDPWGNLYYLTQNRRDYTVGTMGPDGIQGTDDDVTLSRTLDLSRRR